MDTEEEIKEQRGEEKEGEGEAGQGQVRGNSMETGKGQPRVCAPYASKRMFSGLTSLWATPRTCMNSMVEMSCLK